MSKSVYQAIIWIQLAAIVFEVGYMTYLNQISECVHPGICKREENLQTPAVNINFIPPIEGSSSRKTTVVARMFHMLGFVENVENWDVLWSRMFPFQTAESPDSKDVIVGKRPLQENQKVNRFPASGIFGNKALFVTSNGKYLPAVFVMPKEKKQFLEHLQTEKDKKRLWIQKNTNHRGNQVKPVEELDLNSRSLIQQYIDNPFLIGGRKFSLGVYVLWTSFDPIRAYVLDTEILLRFCTKDYYPEDFSDLEKYITDGVEHMNVETYDQMPALDTFVKLQYSGVQALQAFVKTLGVEPSKMFEQIHDAIAENVNRRVQRLGPFPEDSTHFRNSFFELMRWDFLLDEAFNIHLIEANCAPNIPDSSLKERRKRQANFNVLYNTLRASGVDHIRPGKYKRPEYVFRTSDVVIMHDVCYTSNCSECEYKKDCRLCAQCLSSDQEEILMGTFREHINRGSWRRAFPRPITIKNVNSTLEQVLNNDDLIAAWFQQKCNRDNYWCY